MNTVRGGSNIATLNNCGCLGNTSVRVSGNGAFSDNDVSITNNTRSSVHQSRATNVTNYTTLRQNTGFNDSSFNTGRKGSNLIRSGNADAYVFNKTFGGSNMLF
jgi:hypothetical protein